MLAITHHAPRAFLGFSALFLANLSPFFGVTATYVVLWSLAVEEHFYFVWPMIVRHMTTRNLLRPVRGDSPVRAGIARRQLRSRLATRNRVERCYAVHMERDRRPRPRMHSGFVYSRVPMDSKDRTPIRRQRYRERRRRLLHRPAVRNRDSAWNSPGRGPAGSAVELRVRWDADAFPWCWERENGGASSSRRRCYSWGESVTGCI
jgi:hypothetical protein